MNGKQLKNSILQWAIQGKLVPQDPNDEPASVLLDKIRQEKERLIKEKKIKRDKNASIIYRGEDNSYYEKILATGEVKCIDEEVPFEIPQGWEWCRLRNLCTIFGRIGFRGYTKSDMVEKGNGAISISPSNMKENGNMDFNVCSYISWYKYEESPEIQIQINDVLVVKTGSSYGKTCIIKSLPERATINPQIAVLKFIGVIPAWLTSALNSPHVQNQFNDYVIGTSIPTFSQEKLGSTLLPCPPMQEQQRISLLIKNLMYHISHYDESQKRLAELNLQVKDDIKKSLLQEAIQGKLVQQIAEEGTAQELLEQIKTEKQKLVKAGKLKKSSLNDSVIFRGDDNKYYELIGKKCWDITEQIPFEIPSNWEWCRVRNVSNSYIGLTYKPTDIDEKGTIVLRSCNIRNGKLVLDDIVRVSSSISEKLLIEENDIIICARNGSKRLVGKSALIRNLTEPMTFGAFMAICKTPIYEYMFAYLQSDLFFGQLRDVSNTTTINQLTQNKFNDFLIPLPPLREQKRIVQKIEQLMQLLK